MTNPQTLAHLRASLHGHRATVGAPAKPYIAGRTTVSITWITPFDWSTSAIVTVAT